MLKFKDITAFLRTSFYHVTKINMTFIICIIGKFCQFHHLILHLLVKLLSTILLSCDNHCREDIATLVKKFIHFCNINIAAWAWRNFAQLYCFQLYGIHIVYNELSHFLNLHQYVGLTTVYNLDSDLANNK